MNRRLNVLGALTLGMLLTTGCGEAEPKGPNSSTNVVTNISTNSSTANNTSPNSTSPNNEVQCLLDTDCVAPDVCEGTICVATCTVDADCAVGEVCESRTNGSGTICREGDANVEPEGCSGESDPNAFCEAQLGAGAFCDTATGGCVGDVGLTDSYYVVQIQDVTAGADLCESQDPGSDIQGVELVDSGGNSLGWGSIVAENVILTGNDETNFGVVDGTPRSLDADGCVDSFTGNVLSLGCNGWIAVEFLDNFDNPVVLEDGQYVFVYEYGGTCSSGTTDDEFTFSICSDTSGILGGDDSSCTNVLGSGRGVTSFEIVL